MTRLVDYAEAISLEVMLDENDMDSLYTCNV